MTDSTGPGPGTPGQTRPPTRTVVQALLRALGSTVALLAVYYLLPLDHSSTLIAATTLVAGLVLLIVLISFQIRSIVRSRFPGLRAVEALGTSVPLFLLLFASTYLVMASISAGSFNQPLTHTDALYFTVTVFATVGFGDIVPKTETARLVVTGQMAADLVIIGVGARIILGAVTRGRQRQPESAGAGQPGE
jgi:voltage-gated potassium channel